MFLNWNLNMLINACILMTFTTFSLVKGGNQKTYYHLPKIHEKYSDYAKIKLPNNEMIMPLKEFYDTAYNVQFVQFPDIFDNNYDQYKDKLSYFCSSNKYATYLTFIIDCTLEHFVDLLNNLANDLKATIDEEGDHKKYNRTTLHNDILKCITQSSKSSFKQISQCIGTALSKANKSSQFQRNISDFRKEMHLVLSMKEGDLTFNYKMVPILKTILYRDFQTLNTKKAEKLNKGYDCETRPLKSLVSPKDYQIYYPDKEEAKNLYTGYLNAKKTENQILECQKKYKALDKTTYTSKKIGFYLFPQKNEESFEVFKNRRIQFAYHLGTLFREMGIPNDVKFKLLLNASKSIDESYFNKLKSFRALAKESYESYVLRIIAKGYYPLPEKLWKNEKPRK